MSESGRGRTRRAPSSRREVSTTRERLIDTAGNLLRDHGLAGVTTQKIAHGCDLSEGSIYRHFDDLDDLILTALQWRLAGDFKPHIDALAAHAGKRTIEANLRDFVRAIAPIYSIVAAPLGMLAANPALALRYGESLRASGGGPNATLDRIAEYFVVEQRLGRASRGIDARVAANILIGLCFHRSLIGSLFAEDALHADDDQLAAALATIVARGVGVAPPRTSKRTR